jgi:hypothetical protein
MFNNQDPGDATGLEAFFGSRQFGHTPATTAGLGSAARSAGVEETIFRMEFGDARRDVPMPRASRADGDAQTFPEAAPSSTPAGAPSAMRPELAAAGKTASAAATPGTQSPTPRQRNSNKYRMVAVASCVAALVVAGVVSHDGHQHRPPSVSALGHRGGGRSQGGSGNRTTSGAPFTENPGPAGATPAGSGGGGHRSSAFVTSPTSGAGGAPSGHVAVSGAATYNGAPPSSSSTGSSGSSGSGGSAPSLPGTGSNPSAPVATLVASTLSSVASSVTAATGQLGSSVPAAAPATGAVTNAVGTAISGASQTVGSTTS